MAGIWVRSGTIALTSGSKKVTGTGTSWNSGLNKVTKGCALKHNNIDYEVDYVNSDTEFYLVDTYNGATLSGQAYRIQVAVTDTIPELSSRIAQALAYWNGQGANLQLMMSGSGNVTLTFPDGTQVTVPAWGNMQPKDGLLTAIAALTTSADKLFYATGADAVAMTTLSAKGRELIDDANASEMLTTLGVSAFIKSLLDDADAAAALGTLGITKASLAETNSRLATDRVVTPAGLNAVVPYAPTINPTLDLDFAKQKFKYYAGAAGLVETSSMSPLITFTRSSIAKYFDAMGVMRDAAVDTPRIDYDPLTGECKGLLIEESRTNLLNYSSNFRDSSWSRTYLSVIPASNSIDGSLGANKLVESAVSGQHYIAKSSIPVTASATYTFSGYFKAAERSWLMLEVYNGSTYPTACFDLASGAVGGLTNSAIGNITSVGNGWYRCSITVAMSSSATICTVYALIATGNNAVSYSGDGVSGIYADKLQLEVGAFPTSYIQSSDTWTARASTATYYDSNGVLQTAASGVARSAAYDYDADGVLRPIGLLLEGAATNLLLYSEQFDNAAWTKSAATIIANATTAPDGNTTADKLVEDTSTGPHRAYQTQAISASTTYTYSIHAKASERSYVLLATYDGATTLAAVFNLSIGTVISVDSGASALIKKTGNGSYRCSITVTSGASAANLICSAYLHNGTSSSYAGDGTSGIYMWGAQLAAGNYATSYIATTSAQVTRVADTSTSAQATRAADNAVISGANFSQWYNPSEGSVQCSVDVPALGGALWPGVFSLSNNTSNRIGCIVNDSSDDSVNMNVRKNGIDLRVGISSTPVVAGKRKKIAASFGDLIALSGYVDGDVMTYSPPTVGVPRGISNLNLGFYDYKLNGHIRSLKYFPKTLASAELQAITA